MYVAVDFEVTGRHASTTPPRRRAGLFASHEQRIAPAVGPLALVSEDAYRVTKLYGDGRPWRVSFTRDVDVDDFPCKGGTEALFKRNGEFCSGVLSRPHSFGALQFPAGTLVEFYNGRRDGRVQWVTLGADQDIQGVPCKAGTLTQFCFHKRQPYLVTGTLAADHDFNGVRQLAGTEFSIDRKQHLER